MISMMAPICDTDLPPEKKKQIEESLRHAFRTSHPNPDRIGCLAFAKDIMALAWHRKLDHELNRVLEHISRCSPCYSDPWRYLAKYKVQRRLRKGLIEAATVLFLFA